MYGKHWILNNKVCVGNILDFHQIQEKNDNQFKLVIYCEDYQNEECYDEFLYKIYNIFGKIICWGIIFTILI